MAQKEKGTLRPASGRFTRKRTKYPSRIKWRRCQILTLMNDPHVQFDCKYLDFSFLYRRYTCFWRTRLFKLLARISTDRFFQTPCWCFFRNVQHLQKFNYVCLQDDEISELGHTIKLVSAWHLENLRLHSAVRDIYQLTTKSFFQT